MHIAYFGMPRITWRRPCVSDFFGNRPNPEPKSKLSDTPDAPKRKHKLDSRQFTPRTAPSDPDRATHSSLPTWPASSTQAPPSLMRLLRVVHERVAVVHGDCSVRLCSANPELTALRHCHNDRLLRLSAHAPQRAPTPPHATKFGTQSKTRRCVRRVTPWQ